MKLNESKTEIMLIKGNLKTNVTNELSNLDDESSTLAPVKTVLNLGIKFDPELSFKNQIYMAVKNCNFQICNTYAFGKFLDRMCLQVLVHSLVISKTDYCNSLYVSLPNYLLRKLQSVVNRSARLIYSLSPWVPTTSHLTELHWSPLKERIELKICLLAFNALKFGEPELSTGSSIREAWKTGERITAMNNLEFRESPRLSWLLCSFQAEDRKCPTWKQEKKSLQLTTLPNYRTL